MATHKYYDNPISIAHKEIWVKQAYKRVTTCPVCPFLPCLGSFCMFSSGGTAEVVTLHGDAAVFNSVGKDQAIRPSLSPETHFPKIIHGHPSSQQPSGP